MSASDDTGATTTSVVSGGPAGTATTTAEQIATETQPETIASGSSGGFPLVPVVLVAMVVAVALAAIAGYLAGRRRHPTPSGAAEAVVPPPPPPAGSVAAPNGSPGHDELVRAAVDVRDRTSSAALADRLAAGLAAAGWVAIDPTGERFDPAQHQAVDQQTTGDPALHDTVAATERVGYRHGGQLTRYPEVIVYRYQQPHPESTYAGHVR